MLLHIRQLCAGKEQVMAVKVDHNAIKFNQVSLTVVAVVAVLANQSWLVAALALILAASTARSQWSLFRVLYQRVALPQGLLRPHLVEDDPAPHRFAQGGGAAFLGLSWIALAAGAPVLGWALDPLVAALARAKVALTFGAGGVGYMQLRPIAWIGGAGPAEARF